MDGLEAGGGLTLGSPPKEHEPLKLFVGQVPKTVEEPELRAIFEPFGAIHELVVLKDRTTGAHKGTAPAAVARAGGSLATYPVALT